MKIKTILLSAVATLAFAPMSLADSNSTERGQDGELKILYWQAPSILNPYLTGGTKDWQAASIVLEPLGRFDESGAPVPYLAEEIPTVENGGVAEDLKSITWKLKEGLLWSDGSPVTSADVSFTAQYCMHPEGGCAQSARFDGVKSIDIVDDLTVKVNFSEPKPYPYSPFMGAESPILQKAQFEQCLGSKAPECTEANFNPIGTGPFSVVDFRPNDVITYEANQNYRESSKPAFASLTLKGGGDAASAARAVMETGEFDYAVNMQLAPDVLEKIAEGGKGEPISAFGTLVERLELNITNPSPELPEGERSTVTHPHPFLSNQNIRRALSMAIDRQLLVDVGYGQAGRPTCDLVPAPALFASNNKDCLVQDIDGAKALLEKAGWVDSDGDGIRENGGGHKLSVVFQTSTNAVRQDFQALIKDAWNQIGVDVELRNIDGSVFFGGDPGSPDTYQKFYADVEMYANEFSGTDPEAYLGAYRCGTEPKPSSQWQGENIIRFCDAEYDKLLDELSRTGELGKRGEIAKTLNDMVTNDAMIILPLVDRGRVSAKSNSLGGVVLNTWDSELWNIADWYRKN